jgi:putative glycosyltransferase (TIGR04372 family)
MMSQTVRYLLAKSPIRKWQLAICGWMYPLLNFFIYPIVKKHYAKALLQIPPGRQLFLISRLELGTSITQLHYASYWHHYRSPAVILLVSSRYRVVKAAAESLCPEIPTIYFDSLWLRLVIFLCGHSRVHSCLYGKIYAHFRTDCPSALYIYEHTSGVFRYLTQRKNTYTSDYIQAIDPHLDSYKDTVSSDFLKAYINIRQCYDYRLNLYVDYIDLYKEKPSKVPLLDLRKKSEQLKKALGFEGRYVVLNLNCKENYADPWLNRRQIQEPQRYNGLIDSLIERGYTVVVQGREEQPRFTSRKGLIDYPRSSVCSIESDFALYGGAEFAVTTKSGTEYFGPICDIPLLALELTELCCMAQNKKSRFYPKPIRQKSSGALLSWEELLKKPCFFDIGPIAHDLDIEYMNMSEEEIMRALQEFVLLVEDPAVDWMQLSAAQRTYREKLLPLHLDLFYIPGVPCNAYLASNSNSSSIKEAEACEYERSQ